MDKEKYSLFLEYFKRAFQEISSELINIEYLEEKVVFDETKGRVAIIVGITGRNKGRVLVEVYQEGAQKIATTMNYGPLTDSKEVYLFMAEFVNILSGRAVTYINNHFNDSEIRLTPPAIFSGKNLKIMTPNSYSETISYVGEPGVIKIDVGLEGE